MKRLNALTIDVEDYYHVTAFEKQIARSSWNDFPSRVVANTQRLLELLAELEIQATFFVLGWVAEQFPALVRQIHAAGHEIGSHSHWHRLVYQLTPEEFRSDLLRSRAVLEDAAGTEVLCYRAPSFSITARSLWALQILAEEGFRVDSSIYPVYHDRYGIPGARHEPHLVETAAGSIWEFPASVLPLGRLALPVAGGGYFRLYPLHLSRYCLGRINRKQNRPFVFYTHPWELDPQQPRLLFGSRLSRWRHYVNLRTTPAKLRRLLSAFRFGPLREVIAEAAQASRKIMVTSSISA